MGPFCSQDTSPGYTSTGGEARQGSEVSAGDGGGVGGRVDGGEKRPAEETNALNAAPASASAWPGPWKPGCLVSVHSWSNDIQWLRAGGYWI